MSYERGTDKARCIYSRQLDVWFTHPEAETWVDVMKERHGPDYSVSPRVIPCALVRGEGPCFCYDAKTQMESQLHAMEALMAKRARIASSGADCSQASDEPSVECLSPAELSGSTIVFETSTIEEEIKQEFEREKACQPMGKPSPKIRKHIISTPPPRMAPLQPLPPNAPRAQKRILFGSLDPFVDNHPFWDQETPSKENKNQKKAPSTLFPAPVPNKGPEIEAAVGTSEADYDEQVGTDDQDPFTCGIEPTGGTNGKKRTYFSLTLRKAGAKVKQVFSKRQKLDSSPKGTQAECV